MLSRVLLKMTLLLALVIGVLVALVQMSLDLNQQKNAVEAAAEAFLDNITPTVATAAYNYQDAAAEDAIDGLFTQRAIRQVRIINDGQVLAERDRELSPTLPSVGMIADAEEVTLRRALLNPESREREVIGEISVVVDRSVVSPAVVRRLLSYFLLSAVKNLLFGLALVALVYTALTRHIVQIAQVAAEWKPGDGAITPPRPPKFLVGTEIEVLGDRIGEMSRAAEVTISTLETSSRRVQRDNSKLSRRSSRLSDAVRDRTRELDEANLALRRQADRDALTGTFNRGAFDRRASAIVETAMAEDEAVVLLMIDIDYFKPFNDHYGHQTGDGCLKEVAGALESLMGSDDRLLARYGGEEFICLLTNAGQAEGEALAADIHKAIADLGILHERSGVSDFVTASIGLTRETGGAISSLDALVSAADEALYEAKHKGRNRTVVSSDQIRSRVRKRRESISHLLTALDQREFEPFFQAQVDATTGTVVGMEALARWRRTDGQIIGPGEFMPAAEENDLVRLVDAIIFEKCADFLRQAEALGVTIPRLSINLSEEHLRDEAIMDRLKALRETGRTRIAMELLETTALDNPSEQINWTIDKIRDLGFDIEIDDFGTGRTSIISLTTLRPSRLKIARELVMPVENEESRELLSCVLEIARTLNIRVVAEGVETVAQRDALLEMGCTIHQGFLYSRPENATEFLERLRNQGGVLKAS